jgi:hypothetical protein
MKVKERGGVLLMDEFQEHIEAILTIKLIKT